RIRRLDHQHVTQWDRQDAAAELLSEPVRASEGAGVESMCSRQLDLPCTSRRAEPRAQQVDPRDPPVLVHVHVCLLFHLLPSVLLVQQEAIPGRRAVGEWLYSDALDLEGVDIAEPLPELGGCL